MNNELLLNNYLLLLKSTTEVYIHGTIESSNDDVRSLLKTALDETLEHQNRTFNKMVEENYYEVNNIDSNIIKETINKM